MPEPCTELDDSFAAHELVPAAQVLEQHERGVPRTPFHAQVLHDPPLERLPLATPPACIQLGAVWARQ